MPSLSKYVQFIQIRWAETKKDRGSKRISNDDFGYFSKKFAVEYKLLLKTGQLDDALAGRIEPRDYGKSKVEEDIEIMDIETAVESTSKHSLKQSNSKDLSQVEASNTADEEEEPMEIDEQEEIVVEKLENKPADLTKVASNLTNSFIAAGKALSQESLVEAVTHLSEDEDAQSEPGPHEASFDELDQRRASLIDISSQVMLADSDEANKAFLEEQPNFLPEKLSETDREIVNDLIRSQSNTDQMESDAPEAETESEKVQSFGTEKEELVQSPVEEISAVEEIPAAEEIPAPVENDQEPDKAEEVERMETETELTETKIETQSAEVESVVSEADADADSKPEFDPVADSEQLETIKEVCIKDLPDAEKEIEEVASELSENLNADNNDSESSDGESDDDSSASADTSAESGNLESVDEINLTQRDCEDIAIAPSESTQDSTGIAPSAAAPSDMVFTENTKPVTHLVASFESIMSVESEFDAIVPCVAARAAPPAPDAVDLEEIKPSMEQKSNSEPEKATRKSFGERIKGLVRCCQQK